jgi:hypothetical protein
MWLFPRSPPNASGGEPLSSLNPSPSRRNKCCLGPPGAGNESMLSLGALWVLGGQSGVSMPKLSRVEGGVEKDRHSGLVGQGHLMCDALLMAN